MRAHLGRNRLYVTMKGVFSDEEIKACIDRELAEMDRLRPGFDIVSDISELQPFTPRGVDECRRSNAHMIKKGARKIVRVVGKSAAAAAQLGKVSREVGLDAYLAYTVAEAERLLDGEHIG